MLKTSQQKNKYNDHNLKKTIEQKNYCTRLFKKNIPVFGLQINQNIL